MLRMVMRLARLAQKHNFNPVIYDDVIYDKANTSLDNCEKITHVFHNRKDIMMYPKNDGNFTPTSLSPFKTLQHFTKYSLDQYRLHSIFTM